MRIIVVNNLQTSIIENLLRKEMLIIHNNVLLSKSNIDKDDWHRLEFELYSQAENALHEILRIVKESKDIEPL